MADSKFVEELKRAMLTEEKMSTMLLDLCNPDLLPSEIPSQKRTQIRDNLLKLSTESRNHGMVVSKLIARFSGGHSQ